MQVSYKFDAARLITLARCSSAAQTGMDCAACHPCPIEDAEHQRHTFDVDSNSKINGPVTCYDCHARAMAMQVVALPESIYVDPQGGKWSSPDYPGQFGDTATYRFDHMDTVRQHRPSSPARRWLAISAGTPTAGAGATAAPSLRCLKTVE